MAEPFIVSQKLELAYTLSLKRQLHIAHEANSRLTELRGSN